MKHEYSEISATQKQLTFEIPTETVETEIARIAALYAQSARVPGFRQGKVPATVVRQRYKDQILSDVAQDVIPRVVNQTLRERELSPVAPPEIRDVVVAEGQPMTFAAHFEVLPAIDPGAYTGISLRKPAAVLKAGAVDQTLTELQQRAAKWVPVEDRAAMTGDALLMDITRVVRGSLIVTPGEANGDGPAEPMQNVSVELGHTGNPPGFDENLTGLKPGEQKAFTVTYPDDYQMPELAGKTVSYDATIKAIRRKELLPLDLSLIHI